MVNAGFIWGQIADYRAEVQRNGKKEADLVHATLKLDDANFLKSDYGANLDEIKKQLILPIKDRLAQTLNKQKEAFDEASKESVQLSQKVLAKLKGSAPNFKPARDYYSSEILKIKEELVSDKSVQKFFAFL